MSYYGPPEGHDAVSCHKRSLLPDDEKKREIIRLFEEEEQSVNHIVFLFNYELRIDAITDVIRTEFKKRGASNER